MESDTEWPLQQLVALKQKAVGCVPSLQEQYTLPRKLRHHVAVKDTIVHWKISQVAFVPASPPPNKAVRPIQIDDNRLQLQTSRINKAWFKWESVLFVFYFILQAPEAQLFLQGL